MSPKNTIRKEKGIEICSDLLFAGRTRKEIIEEITKDYKVSVASIDNWLKAARPAVSERQAAVNAERDRVDKAAMEATAKRLNLSRERILEEYAKIAFFDIRKIYTVDGGLKPVSELDDETAGGLAGVESFDERVKDSEEVLGTTRKVKIWDKRAALDSICKVLGYNAPDKAEVDHTSGGQPIQQNTTLVIKPRNRREDS